MYNGRGFISWPSFTACSENFNLPFTYIKSFLCSLIFCWNFGFSFLSKICCSLCMSIYKFPFRLIYIHFLFRKHQRQILQHPTPRMVHAEERRTTNFRIEMEMGRTCRKASPHMMCAGNNYVRPLQRQEKQRQAKHQMGRRLFQQTSGTTLV